MKSFLKTLAALGIALVPAVVAGVFACIWFDVMPARGESAALPYAIWFVDGIFAGIFAFTAAGTLIAGKENWNWDDLALGNRIFWPSLAVLAVLIGLAWRFGGYGYAAEYFVPDSAPHTITFLASVGLGMILFRFAVMGPARSTPEMGAGGKRGGRR